MSVWEDHDVENKVIAVLTDVHLVNDYHHFGRPYMTAYQLAIHLHARYPEVAQALGVKVGGAGTGERTSLAQYLSRELSRQSRAIQITRCKARSYRTKPYTSFRMKLPTAN